MISTNIKRKSFLYKAPNLECLAFSISLGLQIKDLNSIKKNICIYIILKALLPLPHGSDPRESIDRQAYLHIPTKLIVN